MLRSRHLLGLVLLLLTVTTLPSRLTDAQVSPAPDPDYFDALWVARAGGALKVDPQDGAVLGAVGDGRAVQAVAVDELRGHAWLLGGGTLRALAFDGTPLLDVPVAIATEAAARMVAHDGTVSVAAAATLYRFDEAGAPLASIPLGGTSRDLALDPVNGSLRVATSNGLLSFAADGTLLGTLPVSGSGAWAVAVDRASGATWLATKQRLQRYGAGGALERDLAFGNVVRLASDGLGGVWAATQQDLRRFNAAGTATVVLAPLPLTGNTVDLAAELAGQRVWVATQQRLAAVTGTGQVAIDLALNGGGAPVPGATTSIAVYADLRAPAIAWTSPLEGEQIRPDAALELAISDIGQGADLATLALTANGAALAATCSETAGGARCVPTSPLPEGNLALAATVADFAGNVSAAAEISVTVVPLNRPPVLATIGNLNVNLGSSLSLQLVASDPDGDALTFAAGPVPLPELARLDSASGLFTYTPTDDDVGTRGLTFAVSDGRLTASETVTLTVIGATPGAPTSLAGRLLDTNDFANGGGETPIVGARITLDGASGAVFSDATGRFRLNALPFGRRVLRIDAAPALPAPDGSRYASFEESIVLIEGVLNDIARPFFLPRIDAASATVVNPAATTRVVNPNLGVTLTIPPNTARNANGSLFTGSITVSEVPAAVAPVSLPETLEPGLLLTIQPVGVTFTTPVPISVPNLDGMAPGNELDLWSVNPTTGLFEKVGVGRVSADGTTVDTISGGVRAASWHTMMPPEPNGDGSGNNDDNQDPDKCDDCNAGSQTALASGNLSISHDLQPYFALNRPRALRLVYNSEQAAPQPILASSTTISRRAAVPVTASASLEVAGLDFGTQLVTNTSGLNESVDEPLRQAVQFSGKGFATGRYRYRMKLSSHYPRSTISTFVSGRAIVHNLAESPIGCGWGLSGLQQVHAQSDGSVLLTEGDGKAQVFEPAPIDLRAWRRQGPPANGNWSVAADGLSVVQSINGDPTFFISPNNFIDTVVRGRFRVETTADDDYVGFVIGYTSPIAESGHEVNTYNMLLFDWKQTDQPSFGGIGREGFALSRVSGRFTDYAPFWIHQPVPGFEVLATDFGSDKGWSDNVEHEFELIYQRDRIKISIDGRVIFDLPGTFEPGRFGFYNYSQSAVRYRSFTAAALFNSPAGDFSTLARTDDGGYLRTFKDGSTMTFRADGRQIGAVDAAGNRSAYGYDAQGRLSTVTDPVGGVTQLTYAGTHLASITDAAGQITRFSHDGNGNLTRIEDPDGSARGFSYDGNGRLLQQTSKRGFATNYAFDFAGRNVGVRRSDGTLRSLAAKATVGLRDPGSALGTAGSPAPVVRPTAAIARYTDGNGNAAVFDTDRFGGSLRTVNAGGVTTTAVRNSAGNPTEIVNPNGMRQRLGYDTRGNLTSLEWSESSGETHRVTLSYDLGRNLVERLVDAGGNAFDIDYDGRGNAIRLTDPTGASRTATYDARGLLTSATDEMGRTTTNTYDARGNTASITTADGVRVQFTRDAVGRVTSVTEAVGLPEERTSYYAYDPAGNVASFTDPGGAVTTFLYDSSGNTIEIQRPNGVVVRRAYDSMNRLIRIEDPARGITRFGYDGNGNLTEIVKANGARSTMQYDANNRMVRSVDPIGGEQRFSYDDRGNLLRFENAAGAAWTYTYDRFDRTTAVTDPLGNRTSFTYDARNFLASATDAKGQTTTYATDSMGRVTAATLVDNVIRRTYDAAGNVTRIEDQDSRIDLTYDAVGRVLTEGVTDVGFQPAALLTSTRDALGRRTSLLDSFGGLTQFGYDDRHLTGIVTPAGEGISFAHDPAGRLQRIGLPNGVNTDLGYDAAGRLGSLAYRNTGGTLLSFGYTYDVIGKLIAVATGSQVRSYSYDALQRLIAGGTTGLPELYSYDEVGNRVSSFLSATHQHDAANRLVEDDTYAYGYDANGNQTSRRSKATGALTSYTYDAQNQLTRIDFADGTFASYRYDGLGRRFEKNVNGDLTRYLYDGPNILLEVNAAGSLEARYTHGTGSDRPLVMQRGGASYSYLADHQGSIRFVLDAAGNVVNRYEYDSFGRRLVATEGVESPYGFTGREYDAESGLYFYRARYYDPATGRFISQDPARFDSGSSHFYSYLENDPANGRDPSGNFSFWDALDVASFLWSAKEFIDCPSLGNFGNLLLDGIGLLPIIPGIGTVRRAVDLADSASDAARLGDRARDAVNAADNARDAANAADAASDLSRRAQDILGQGDDVVVIGRRDDTAVAGEWPGHTTLNVPNQDWSIGLNDAWVAEAVNQGRSVYLASPTNAGNLYDAAAGRSTVFGRELQQFLDAGYTRQGDYLIPPGR